MPNIDKTGTPITESTHHEWDVELDFGRGLKKFTGFARARFVNQTRDIAFNLAKSPDGNYSNVTRVGGGGAVTVLFTIDNASQLWLGGVMQMRRNISDKPVFNLIRGYKEPNEDNLSTALHEAIDESGREDLMYPIRMRGETLNADSAMNDSVNGGGVDFFRIEVPFEALVKNEDGTLRFNTTGLTDKQRKEGIYQVVFIRGNLNKVAHLTDAFTIVGLARLISDLGDLLTPDQWNYSTDWFQSD